MYDPLDPIERPQLEVRLRYLVWRWYRIRGRVADEIVREALRKYLEKRRRSATPDEDPVMLVRRLRDQCRAYLMRSGLLN